MKILTLVGLAVVFPVLLVLGAGQLGLLAGSPPTQIGVVNGRLRPPSATPNSVSSQAGLYPSHPQLAYAAMEPIKVNGEGELAMQRLAKILRGSANTLVVTESPDYLYARCTTPILKFTDDVEFWFDKSQGAIQFRSASRIGRKDFGVNRARMESIRAKFQS